MLISPPINNDSNYSIFDSFDQYKISIEYLAIPKIITFDSAWGYPPPPRSAIILKSYKYMKHENRVVSKNTPIPNFKVIGIFLPTNEVQKSMY